MLLVSSVVALAVAKVGLVPAKVSALGLDLTPKDQTGFLILLGLITVYFILAFVIYGTSDFLAWRIELSSVHLDKVNKARKIAEKINEEQNKIPIVYATQKERLEKSAVDKILDGLGEKYFSRIELWRKFIFPIAIARGLFEFIVPICVAGYALYSLAKYACSIG